MIWKKGKEFRRGREGRTDTQTHTLKGKWQGKVLVSTGGPWDYRRAQHKVMVWAGFLREVSLRMAEWAQTVRRKERAFQARGGS